MLYRRRCFNRDWQGAASAAAVRGRDEAASGRELSHSGLYWAGSRVVGPRQSVFGRLGPSVSGKLPLYRSRLMGFPAYRTSTSTTITTIPTSITTTISTTMTVTTNSDQNDHPSSKDNNLTHSSDYSQETTTKSSTSFYATTISSGRCPSSWTQKEG